MLKGNSLAQRVFNALEAEVDWGVYESWTGNRGVEVQTYGGRDPIMLLIVDDIAVIPEQNLNRNLVLKIAAGMFIEHSEHVENFHASLPFFTTGYAEEDLPSDMINLYAAWMMRYHGFTYKQVIAEVAKMCKVLETSESIEVYNNEYQEGDGFMQGWRQWSPRLMPVSCVSCSMRREWPTPFYYLYNQYLSARPQRGGLWWWHENVWLDGVLTGTGTEFVYALENFPSWPVPLP